MKSCNRIENRKLSYQGNARIIMCLCMQYTVNREIFDGNTVTIGVPGPSQMFIAPSN